MTNPPSPPDPQAVALVEADALPDDWAVTAGRLVVQTLVGTLLRLEDGTLDAASAKVREAVATALYRTLPDGIRTAIPVDDQRARILAHYVPLADPTEDTPHATDAKDHPRPAS